MSNPDHQKIIDEIMAGGRVMPPLEDRIKIRDEHLAKVQLTYRVLPQTMISTGRDNPRIHYDSTSGKFNNGD